MSMDIAKEIEYLLDGVAQGTVRVGTLYQALLRAPVFALFNKEWDGKEPVSDLKTLLLKDAEGAPLVPLFSSAERTLEARKENPDFDHPRQVAAEGMLKVFDPSWGLVLNPASGQKALQIAAAQLNQLRDHFGPERQPVVARGETLQ